MRARRAITSSALAILLGIAVAFVPASLRAGGLGDRFATSDPRALGEAVAAVERAPATTPNLAEAIYAAARACEDKLVDPVRALALYDRLARIAPDANVTRAAERHAERLRALIGHGHERETSAFAELVANADGLGAIEVVRLGDALAAEAWPGAPEVELWLADWLRRSAIAADDPARFAEADAHYAQVIASWPSSAQAWRARSGRVGAAIDAHVWARARTLVAMLPGATPEDQRVREDLERLLARGERRAHLDTWARIACVFVLVLLVGSLVEAMLHGGLRWPSLRPPFELWFLAPIAAVLVLAAFTANQVIAPAVMRIAIAGVALAWLSGATLDLVRARGRSIRVRALGHIALCALGVVAVAYIAVSSSGLYDMLAETVKFGPD